MGLTLAITGPLVALVVVYLVLWRQRVSRGCLCTKMAKDGRVGCLTWALGLVFFLWQFGLLIR
ncbi:hypothetical protein RchiOBHm_Chr5g0074551 [Rosa chinensis]|uniref:Uncharacterized protein n=1 Tax=Rosa chinensis TaxID=74649 RepID=A0A2P6QL77_ROSCH|nr:hypothetical protein RchiOBHm_Chr5g0074551 [Rosa chinensis]